jgi:hypothetical protein
MLQILARVQGWFYVLTGVWALVDIDSFEWVTGPKTDDWLVKTVGVLVTIVGGVLLHAARRERITAEIALLAAGCAVGLACIDLVYALNGTISPIYLADTAAELALAGLW